MNTEIKWANEFNLPDGYIFKDENGNVINTTKVILEKKQKGYPKNYKECCNVLGLNTMDNDVQGYKWELIIRFQELLIARDAYWKIAGEEMGLGKPWKPDWANVDQNKHCIRVDVGDIILHEGYISQNILAFPTKEMRNAFYENFMGTIIGCKELL